MKTTVRYHLTLVRMASRKKNPQTTNAGEGMEKREHSCNCWWECKLIQPLWKTVWRFLKKLGIKLPYDPVIPLLGIYLEESKIEKDTCTAMFTASLFTRARIWKQPRYPITDEWIKKLWDMEYTMECCAVLCLVTQLCLTLFDPMDCGPPGFSVRGDSSGKNTQVGCPALLQEIFPTQGSNPGLPHCRQILHHLRHQESPSGMLLSHKKERLLEHQF